jgi:hypothetical protein
MAITTVDGIIAGLLPPYPFIKTSGTLEAAGVLYSPVYVAGAPGAMSAPASGLSGATVTARAGLINVPTPGAGNSYLAGLSVYASLAGGYDLIDRIWDNSGLVVTTTTAQTINSSTWPARDADGATAGRGVAVGIEVRTATTNAGAISNMTFSYTNSAGTAGRTGTIPSFPATAAVGTFVEGYLQAGDEGVQSIQSWTLGTSLAAGAVHLVAFRRITFAACGGAGFGRDIDALGVGFPRLYDGTALHPLWVPSATTAVGITSQIRIAQG